MPFESGHVPWPHGRPRSTSDPINGQALLDPDDLRGPYDRLTEPLRGMERVASEHLRPEIAKKLDKLIDPIKEQMLKKDEPFFVFNLPTESGLFKDVHSQRERDAMDIPTREKKITYWENDFMVMISVIRRLVENLVTGQTMTIRDLFYREVPTFKTQKAVDDCLTILAQHLRVPREALGIVASVKGLMTGPLEFNEQANTLKPTEEPHSCMIATLWDTEITLPQDWQIDCVLIVEKEAIYSRFKNSDFVKHSVLITGKGYPDLATQSMVYLLWQHCQRSKDARVRATPFYCWVDFDPFGFEIMLTYRNSSKQRTFQWTGCPDLRWIGLHAHEALEPKVHLNSVPLSFEDFRRLKKLLDRDDLQPDGELGCWRPQLEAMQYTQSKVELEAFIDARNFSDADTIRYLTEKMTHSVIPDD